MEPGVEALERAGVKAPVQSLWPGRSTPSSPAGISSPGTRAGSGRASVRSVSPCGKVLSSPGSFDERPPVVTLHQWRTRAAPRGRETGKPWPKILVKIASLVRILWVSLRRVLSVKHVLRNFESINGTCCWRRSIPKQNGAALWQFRKKNLSSVENN